MIKTNCWWETEGRAETEALLARLLSGESRQTTPSAYETARLVSLARWLPGHDNRLRFLTAAQRPDGGWGEPDGYGLVPTLSATEALLTVLLHEPPVREDDRRAVVEAAGRGLTALFHRLGTGSRPSIPDTIGAEVLVPQLVDEINGHLDRLAAEAGPERFARWSATSARLGLPAGMDDTALVSLRGAAKSGRPLPSKVWHSLECLGPDARAAAGVEVTDGIVGGSPAATVAWLGGMRNDGSVRRLDALQARYGGPVPGICPITVFEHSWVIAALADAGVESAAPWPIVAGLRRACGPLGAPAAPGLPADADDTAAVLYALARAGSPASADCLWHFQADRYFRCFIGERTASTSTNGHVLDALLVSTATDEARRTVAIAEVADWLIRQQEPDGSWWDKWHAAPYYATYVCASALSRSGRPGTDASVAAGVRWLVDTQRADGSWGRWKGTEEETSYAVQTLLHTGTDGQPGLDVAAARGCAYLLRPDRVADDTPLWHDKDLYTPVNVVAANRLAAVRLAADHPRVAELVAWPEPERRELSRKVSR